MEIKIIIDDKIWEDVKGDFLDKVVKSIKDLNLGNNNLHASFEWVDEAEAQQILGYRSKTKMQGLRNARAIVFSKYGRKIKYNRPSLMDFLEKNKKTNTYNYGSY